jgi:hypothetical protein
MLRSNAAWRGTLRLTITLGLPTQPIDANLRKLVKAVAGDVMHAEKPAPRTRLQ